MAVPESHRRSAGEELDIEKIQNKLEKLRKKAAVGGFSFHVKMGPFELGLKLRNRISLCLVPEILEAEPQSGTKPVQEKESPGVRCDHDKLTSRSEDPE